MSRIRPVAASLLLALALAAPFAHAQDPNLLPKYGLLPKNDAQRAADLKLFEAVDANYGGNRAKAAAEAAARGWLYLRQGNAQDAMRRFNQAWLLDKKNGNALWGMAAVMGERGRSGDSLALFSEAAPLIGDDIDFAVDYARSLGMAAAESKDPAMLKEAFARFEKNHRRSPQHALNLQNWAITLYHTGRYADAWKKIKLAEATPRRADLDPAFIAALQGKMPRPRP